MRPRGACWAHPVTPASASEAPMSDKKRRRLTEPSQTLAACGNSRSRRARNSGVSASSSRQRQYSRPWALSSRSVSEAVGLFGQLMTIPVCGSSLCGALGACFRSVCREAAKRRLPPRKHAVFARTACFRRAYSEFSLVANPRRKHGTQLPINVSKTGSAMACRAIGEAIVLVYLVDLHQLAAAAELIGRRLPGHVVDLVVGPQMPLRLPVAVDAPLHVQRGMLPGQRHQ